MCSIHALHVKQSDDNTVHRNLRDLAVSSTSIVGHKLNLEFCIYTCVLMYLCVHIRVLCCILVYLYLRNQAGMLLSVLSDCWSTSDTDGL